MNVPESGTEPGKVAASWSAALRDSLAFGRESFAGQARRAAATVNHYRWSVVAEERVAVHEFEGRAIFETIATWGVPEKMPGILSAATALGKPDDLDGDDRMRYFHVDDPLAATPKEKANHFRDLADAQRFALWLALRDANADRVTALLGEIERSGLRHVDGLVRCRPSECTRCVEAALRFIGIDAPRPAPIARPT